MKLSRLLAPLGLACPEDPDISHLTCHSREVCPGSLFAALEGTREDGRLYIPEALDRGAAAILCREWAPLPIPIVAHPHPRTILSPLAAEFYGHPANAMFLIAVTGTKGKTTTAHMLREILLAAGHKPGMIGTLGAFVGRERLANTDNTTPEPITLHRLLSQMADAGCTHGVLEASSQAMKLHRLAGITFDAALFLNLSGDHIGPGEHETMEEYRACKAALFRQCRLAVGNGCDPAWPVMKAALPEGVPSIPFGEASVTLGEGLSTMLAPDIPLSLPGICNGQNGLAALTLCQVLRIPEEAIRGGLARTSVPGRMELIPNQKGITVFTDYAHNGESFRGVLSTVKQYPHRQITVVFGAGGNRPPQRRRDMAREAARWADFAVITADNPRWEPVEAICGEISRALAGILPHAVIPDRREAIHFALDRAQPGDIVALLGKGHEEYMEIRGQKIPFSERQIVAEFFARR